MLVVSFDKVALADHVFTMLQFKR